MKHQHPFKTFLLTSALALAIPATVYAQPGADSPADAPHCAHHGMHKQHGMPPFFKDLNLTDDQKAQIRTRMQAEKSAMREQWKERHALMQEMHAVSHAESFDSNKADQLANQLASLEKQQILARAQKSHDIFMILTPEQREKMAAHRKAREDRLKDRAPPPPPEAL